MHPSRHVDSRSLVSWFATALLFAYGCGGSNVPDDARTQSDSAAVTDVGGSGTDASGADASVDTGPVMATCDRTATDAATLASEFAAATAGQTICLGPGAYGTFRGAAKSGRVTVRAQPGAMASMEVAFRSAQNITLEALTIEALDLSRSRDITVASSRFTGQAIVHAGMVADANIVFDGNDHRGVRTCSGCFAAQLHVDSEGEAVSGVTIRNSRFGDSFADGIRPDVNTVLIENNEFSGFEDMDPYHTDPIQIYGGRRVTIRRNFFHDNAVASNIGGWDGNDHNVVEDNVIVGSARTGEAISLASDNGSVIRHNTLVQGQCAYNWRCGIINIDHKTDDPASTETIVQDNITSEIRDRDAMYMSDHNLLTGMATPVYVGPATTYEGYRLAAGSPGKGAASDGMDIGIR